MNPPLPIVNSPRGEVKREDRSPGRYGSILVSEGKCKEFEVVGYRKEVRGSILGSGLTRTREQNVHRDKVPFHPFVFLWKD